MANISRFPHHKLNSNINNNNSNDVSVQELMRINFEKKAFPQTTCTDNHRGKMQHNNKKPNKSKLNNDPLCSSQKKKKSKRNVKSTSTTLVRNCQYVLTDGQQLNNYSTPPPSQQKNMVITSQIPSLQNDSFVVLPPSHDLPSGFPSQKSASCQNESHQFTFSDDIPSFCSQIISRQNRSSSFTSQHPQQFPHQPSHPHPHQHPHQHSHQPPHQHSHQPPHQHSHQPPQQPPHQPPSHQPPQQSPQQQCNGEMMVQGSNILEFYEVKLPGMDQPILVPKLIIEKTDFEPVQTSSPTELRADQRPVVTVNLPRNSKNSLLCEEPWWLSSKGTVAFSQDDDNDDNVEGEYESAHAIQIATGVYPLVKLPPHGSKSLTIKSNSKKEFMWINGYNGYCHLNDITSNSINFESEPLIVRLPPKAIPNTRFNIQNLKIETNIELNKDDDDAFFASLGCSTLSTPMSETSTTSFSNTSTYAESATTAFTEEEIINDVKHCNSRSPSVLSTLSSEHLSPVLEEDEEEEEDKSEIVLPVEECQEEMIIEEPVDVEISSICGSEDSEHQTHENDEEHEDQEHLFPHLLEIVEHLEKLEPDSDEALRIRRQLERISEENYPDSLPLSNKWTMYYSDTSATKTNTRIVSKNKYSSTLNTVFKCNTVPELCSNLREFYSKVKPSEMKTFGNLSFFKGDIMPMWEDEVNQKGGRFTLCPARNRLDSLWDSIILLLAGETIDDNNVICGAVCARRSRGDRVELWISGNADYEAIDRIRDLLAAELGSDIVKNVKYKKHYEKS
ncbi:19533_t:CDS:2 [Funneliformis geosporum]|uniref:7911_t:CDS:1 n=1 Tax=Funneliformis geosporum TaxID=1117311 RepID=A0A9W4STT2_9GLOM|nr:19533_t:CDS:2 [Funneliformis geosporum]CAI2180376.1 7911_t:CDS:2 [Funneliformis geosporum]